MKETRISLSSLMHAANCVKTKWPNVKPFASLVFGSGWADVIKAFNVVDELPYEKIWGLGKAGVEGHANKLALAEVNGKHFFVFQGRRHWYEGEGWTPVVTPAYISEHLGASVFFATNSAGGISYPPGSLMMVSDHINLMANHPLMGRHHEEFGERFPDQSEVYSSELRNLIKETAKDTKVKVEEGVYLAVSGPTYETPAEIRAHKILGADAVGMSTIPEAIFASCMGLKVAAISCISNHAAGISKTPLSHKEVTETGKSVMPELARLMPKVIEKISQI